jgi:hypothetical protein
VYNADDRGRTLTPARRFVFLIPKHRTKHDLSASPDRVQGVDNMKRRYFWVVAAVLLILLAAAWETAGFEPDIDTGSWPAFHRDPENSGVAHGVGNIGGSGPLVRWRYQVTEIPADALASTRWTTTFPLGDVNGDGALEVVVTTPTLDKKETNHLFVLEDRPGQSPPVGRLWTITETVGLDMYSPALADVNGDGLLDAIYATGDGRLYALEGETGVEIWSYESGRKTEAGPTIGDLDGDGHEEVVLVTDCDPGKALFVVKCPDQDKKARLIVLPVQASGVNVPKWVLEHPFKMDSAVPALADIDMHEGTNRRAVVAGTWGGELLVA